MAKIGLQLYSIREDMERDMEEALKAVSEMGYECVEFAGFFGKTAEEVKAILDKYGLEAASLHRGYEMEDEIEYYKTIGVKYATIPGISRSEQKGGENYAEALEKIKRIGRKLKESGITLCYHNHDREFKKYEDKFLLDWLYEDVPADLLETEIDTCWVRYAGYDPCEYLKKYAGRAHIVHLKDFTCDRENWEEESKIPEFFSYDGFNYKSLGDGIVDVLSVVKTALEGGAKYLIVEQDESTDMPAMEAVKRSREYLKKLGY